MPWDVLSHLLVLEGSLPEDTLPRLKLGGRESPDPTSAGPLEAGERRKCVVDSPSILILGRQTNEISEYF